MKHTLLLCFLLPLISSALAQSESAIDTSAAEPKIINLQNIKLLPYKPDEKGQKNSKAIIIGTGSKGGPEIKSCTAKLSVWKPGGEKQKGRAEIVEGAGNKTDQPVVKQINISLVPLPPEGKSVYRKRIIEKP
jgi:hypothetical protein